MDQRPGQEGELRVDLKARGELPASLLEAQPACMPYTHLGAAGGTADKWPLLLQIHLGFLINLQGQRKRERGKQKSMNTTCFWPRKQSLRLGKQSTNNKRTQVLPG